MDLARLLGAPLLPFPLVLDTSDPARATGFSAATRLGFVVCVMSAHGINMVCQRFIY